MCILAVDISLSQMQQEPSYLLLEKNNESYEPHAQHLSHKGGQQTHPKSFYYYPKDIYHEYAHKDAYGGSSSYQFVYVVDDKSNQTDVYDVDKLYVYKIQHFYSVFSINGKDR